LGVSTYFGFSAKNREFKKLRVFENLNFAIGPRNLSSFLKKPENMGIASTSQVNSLAPKSMLSIQMLSST
jgi:hypothetical protein